MMKEELFYGSATEQEMMIFEKKPFSWYLLYTHPRAILALGVTEAIDM